MKSLRRPFCKESPSIFVPFYKQTAHLILSFLIEIFVRCVGQSVAAQVGVEWRVRVASPVRTHMERVDCRGRIEETVRAPVGIAEWEDSDERRHHSHNLFDI